MEQPTLPKKRIFLWTLYDFANSIAVIVFAIYFSQWLVVDRGVSDLWYNLLYVGSTILVLATTPIWGAIADKRGVQMPYLRVTTTLQFTALAIGSVLAVLLPAHGHTVLLVALLFMLANYFYQFTFTFYNALLPNLAPTERQGLISGIGQAGNWMGQVVGIILILPVATGAIYFFGEHGRAQTFLPSTILFFLLALPMLIFFKDSGPARAVSVSVREEYRNFFHSLRGLLQSPGLGRYLLAFFFFNDAALTAENNIAIYMQQVFHVSDTAKSYYFLGVLLTAALGALVGGKASDRIGLKRSLMYILLFWIIIFPIMASLTSFTLFAIVSITFGFMFGATWTVTRAVMSYLTPHERVNHGFSYYTLAERFSTFVGPVSWGLITTLLVAHGPVRYQIALGSLSVFIFIGLLIARKIPSDRKPAVPAAV
jgi:UMF1 family MFS transporter